MLKKVSFTSLFLILSLIVLPSQASDPLEANVNVEFDNILPGEVQNIQVTSNKAGFGLLIVLQPAEGDPWESLFEKHPALKIAWENLPDSVQDWVENRVGGKIVSYCFLKIADPQVAETKHFPTDFEGINGEPNTLIPGKYKVILIFVSEGDRCTCGEKDFDCASWHVVPEVPLGTITALIVPLAVVLLKKKAPWTALKL